MTQMEQIRNTDGGKVNGVALGSDTVVVGRKIERRKYTHTRKGNTIEIARNVWITQNKTGDCPYKSRR